MSHHTPTPSSTAPTGALVCFDCGTGCPSDELQTVCGACGMPLRVDVALPTGGVPANVIDRAEASMWRYAPMLPIDRAQAVTLGEGWTPLLEVGDGILVKDESRNPTGSFKARGMSMAVSAAIALGAERLVAPSAGNAAGALSAYGARAGVPVAVAMPDDTPKAFVDECRLYGADVTLVPGTISDAGHWLADNGTPGDFNVSTLKEPYRIEGKKTMAYEIWEQLDGDLPDVMLYPTGGGTGLIGMWKAFGEMAAMGWPMSRQPRLVTVQAEGCAPVVRGLEDETERTTAWEDPVTTAYGLRVPAPIGGFLCLRAVRETNGTGVTVGEADIATATRDLASRSGIDVCPEGGAVWAAYQRLRSDGWIGSDERAVLFNTGTGLKYR